MNSTMNQPLIIEHAFITAAGWGKRMLPLTEDRPKPMVEAAGQPIIGHVLDRLVAARVKHIVVNLFYKPEMLQHFLQQYEAAHPGLTIVTVKEETLLDTGGGIRNGLDTLPDGPFYIVSGDSFWEDSGAVPALAQLAREWDGDKMDMLLLLQPLKDMYPTAGTGDYHMDEAGKLKRAGDKSGAYAWTSVRIIKNKRLFDGTPEGPFSFLDLMDAAQSAGKLYGRILNGQWHHLTSPGDVRAVNAYFADRKDSGESHSGQQAQSG